MANTIVARPDRGAYKIKGTPGGIKIPKAPTAGLQVTGKQGVNWVYRPGGPSGAGFYKKPKAAATTGTNASGATIATPPTTVTTTTSTPPTPEWWNTQMGAGVSTNMLAPILGAEQNQIGSTYGLVLRRDTTEGSATKGQPLYRLAGEAAGTGTVRQSGFDDKGNPVYKDGAGKVVTDIANLALDYTALKQGEPGYLQGAFGNAAAKSEQNQFGIGDVAARAGVGRSGMRGQAAIAENQNAQDMNAALTGRAASDYTTNLGKWAALYNQIYTGLVPRAEALAAPTTTTTTVPVVPPVVPTPSAGGGLVSGQRLSGGPKGEFITQVNGILGIRDIPVKGRIQQLESIGRDYALTPAQRKYLANEIKKFRKLNKVD
ncbi:hypothetical protein UFOVP1158_40 [uncultured Caudovirales phage]|uniref:Uncharacterized protein n=1 Tax=uncultured Caudovirales phage TaxID=2100421 RepID=A0A6J5QSU5_9CAUD|nr:hypothetical protein UFOVP1158_40 [uncultured Caudovirales phage]